MSAPENRDETGRFVPGVSGNPGGRPRDENGIAELARSHGPAALQRLVELMASKDERVSLSACVALLDRGYGKPKQAAEITGKDGTALINQDRPLVATAEFLRQFIRGTPETSAGNLQDEAEAKQ